MEGAALAAKRKFEDDLTLAWHTAGFSGAAAAGKLKPLAHYMKRAEGAQQSPKELLGALRFLQDAGASVNIRKVSRGP